MNALQVLLMFHDDCHFWDFSENKPASNSCLRRLLENSAVVINGKKVKPKDMIEFPITEFVMFPKSDNRRCTLI